jgi:hypothetical protein
VSHPLPVSHLRPRLWLFRWRRVLRLLLDSQSLRLYRPVYHLHMQWLDRGAVSCLRMNWIHWGWSQQSICNNNSNNETKAGVATFLFTRRSIIITYCKTKNYAVSYYESVLNASLCCLVFNFAQAWVWKTERPPMLYYIYLSCALPNK